MLSINKSYTIQPMSPIIQTYIANLGNSRALNMYPAKTNAVLTHPKISINIT